MLGQYGCSEIYKNTKHFTNVKRTIFEMKLSYKYFFKVHEISQIKIFRFEAPIVYFNADYFRENLLNAVGIDSKTGRKRDIHPKGSNEAHSNIRSLTHAVIDCSSINQIDYSGGKIFLQTIKELNDYQFKVYLCHLRRK